MREINTKYCKSCRKRYVEVDCDLCRNRHKGVCDQCIHWKFLKDHFEIKREIVIEEKE